MNQKDIQKILKDYEDGKLSKIEFFDRIDSLEKKIHEDKKINEDKRIDILKSFCLLRRYIGDRGASTKMLLENIAIML
jgi:hypothetical protein